MRDEKALRSALLLKRYCGERGCDEEECTFRTKYGICVLQATRLPEDWQLDGLKREDKDDR